MQCSMVDTQKSKVWFCKMNNQTKIENPKTHANFVDIGKIESVKD